MRILVNHDGQQLGPYSLEEVRAALQAGSLNIGDLAWVEGTPSWVPLSSIVNAPDGGAAFAAATAQYASVPYQQVGETSGLAITSLVLGILSYVLFCIGFFFSIPAIICGHIARANVRNSQGRLRGEGLALAGLICGYAQLGIFALFLAFGAMGPVISGAVNKGRETSTMNDARQISMACIRYASDHDGKYPDSLDELADNQGLDRKVLQRPGAAGFDYFGKGKTQAGITEPATTAILAAKNANPQGKRVVGYADGHVGLDAFTGEDGGK